MKSPDESSSIATGLQFVCPQCHTNVVRRGEAYLCESAECRRKYPIIDDIPKFIVEEADQLEPAEWESAVASTDSAAN